MLIAFNALVWVAILATGWTKSTLVDRLALLPTGTCGSGDNPGQFYPRFDSEGLCRKHRDGQWFPGVSDGAYWQLVTSMFSHVEIWHIGLNMLVLWFLGPQLEGVLGRARFLALYVVPGLAGSVCVYWFSDERHRHPRCVGCDLRADGRPARGGVQGARQPAVHRPLAGDQRGLHVPVPGVSWQGHLGGFLGGVLVTALIVYAPKDNAAAPGRRHRR